MSGLGKLARRVVVLGMLVLGVVALARPAGASIAPPPPAHRVYERADVVYVGVVTKVKDGRMWLRPVTVLRGKPSADVPALPVVDPDCMPGTDQEPFFAVGDRVFVAAETGEGYYRLVDHIVSDAKITGKDDEVARVAMAKEMLTIVALPDTAERTRRLAGLMSSKNPHLARAGADFVIHEIGSPEKARAIEAELVAAVSSRNIWCRRAALSALHGVAPAGAFEAIAKRIGSDDQWEHGAACAALAAYDRADAVTRIEHAAAEASDPFLLANLGFSPRPEARALLREMLLPQPGIKADSRRIHAGLRGYQFRLKTRDATDADVQDLLTRLRRGVLQAHTYDLFEALALTRRASVADDLLAVLRSGADVPREQHAICAGALWKLVQPDDAVARQVLERVRADAELLIERFDEGVDDLYMCWLLRAVHTAPARAALERRSARDDPDGSSDATRTLHAWDD